ncbi:hypothetical protein CCR91_12630, partial [Thiorhodovibrio winogradskyi]|nr:hypothetical protein [Thiorhodovibrio winogradskyi]
MFANHNHKDFDVVCYNTGRKHDSYTDKLSEKVDSWVNLAGLSDRAAADKIRADAIDILIDLSGHTAHNRLPVFAQRPAPVQVTWLGYSDTTGLAAIDYILADSCVAPENEDANFSERVWRMPNCYLCYTIPLPISPRPSVVRGWTQLPSSAEMPFHLQQGDGRPWTKRFQA